MMVYKQRFKRNSCSFWIILACSWLFSVVLPRVPVWCTFLKSTGSSAAWPTRWRHHPAPSEAVEISELTVTLVRRSLFSPYPSVYSGTRSPVNYFVSKDTYSIRDNIIFLEKKFLPFVYKKRHWNDGQNVYGVCSFLVIQKGYPAQLTTDLPLFGPLAPFRGEGEGGRRGRGKRALRGC